MRPFRIYYEEVNRYCLSDGWAGSFDKLSEAKEDCTKNEFCVGVHDYKCDGERPFKICNGTEFLSTYASTKGTCTHKKEKASRSNDFLDFFL